MKNKKKSSKTKCSKILDQTSTTSSINNRNTSKYSLAENRRFFRGFNYTRCDRNVIVTSIFKTIEDPLEIGKNEIVPALENMDDLREPFCEVMYSIVTFIQRKKNRIETSVDNV